jgi:hypothetical protein
MTRLFSLTIGERESITAFIASRAAPYFLSSRETRNGQTLEKSKENRESKRPPAPHKSRKTFILAGFSQATPKKTAFLQRFLAIPSCVPVAAWL